MIAAIYARKSNEEGDVARDQKSVERQIEGARAFIALKGWTLHEEHVYEDDAVSGALFATRRHFQRMMSDAEAGAFDLIVFYDLDRFGRHGHNTMVALNHLADLGIAVWDFSTGTCLDLDSFEGRLTTTLKAEFAQQYRDQVRKHTRASHRRKAEQGLVTGGKVFGYDNVCRTKGETVRVKNDAEAAVVVEIFSRYAAGEGAYTIAAALNSRGAPSPRAQQGRPSGWSVSTIREVLKRPLYRGEIVWGRTKSAYGRELGKLTTRNGRKREKGQIPTPEETWVRLPFNESLCIVDPELAARADARRTDRRTRYLSSLGAQNGKAPEKSWGKYLLTGGMLICPTCGGHFEGLKYPKEIYVCSTRRRKPFACSNTLALPMSLADNVVLDMIEGEVLGRAYIEELLAMVHQSEADGFARLAADRDRLRGEVEKLVGSIALGEAPGSIVSAIREREQQIARLDVQLRAPRPERVDIEQLRAALEQRAAQWKAELRTEPQVARVLVRRLVGPLTLVDPADTAAFIEWETSITPAILEGLAPIQVVASPPGFEPGFQP
jgi:site-specific DNA recombinase